MLRFPLLPACLVFTSLALEGLTLGLALPDRYGHELRRPTLVMVVVGVVVLAWASLWRAVPLRRRRVKHAHGRVRLRA